MRRMRGENFRRLLCQLQDEILQKVLAGRRRARAGAMAAIAARTNADFIYGVDRISEAAILGWFGARWPKSEPVEVVMEGLEEACTFPAGTKIEATKWKIILDPIDGTRGLMYDKRSAWSLAGIAPQKGAETTIGDIFAAAMTELPTSKGAVADQLSAVRGGGVKATRRELATGRRTPLRLRPSSATNLAHGFASFAKFFPAGKTWLAELEERVWRELGEAPDIFDDQYISTGGQLYEVIVGHDRFVADLRPLAFRKLGLKSSLTCHPYDICTELIAREAGCVVSGVDGKAIRAPLDTTTAVTWVAYANSKLARRIGPALRRVLRGVS